MHTTRVITQTLTRFVGRSAILLSALASLHCDSARTHPGTEGSRHRTNPVVDITTVPASRGAIAERVYAPGSIAASRESHIGAEVTGRIVNIFVSEGDRVEGGAPLFQIDPVPYEMALRQAEAGVDVAMAERRQIEADLSRGRTLRQQAVMAQQELDRLVTALAVAQAQERQAQEAVALARHNLQRTVVTAPYASSVAQRLADEGTTALVQPQTIVMVLQETVELEANATIPESQLALVRLGDVALLHVEGMPEPIRTHVSSVSDSIDPATRTYRVKMRVPNPDLRLKAGVFAQVEIQPQAKLDAIVIPRAAIRTEEGRTRVLIVRDGRAAAVPVEIGIESDEAAEVLKGIDVGTEVIVGDAARTIAPGMAVRIVPAGERPAA